MPQEVFFQCSLPRVGSTMFQNLISQDQRFYASGNNGLLNLTGAAETNFINSPEFKAQDSDLMNKAFRGFCKSSIHGFYNAITQRPFAIDKSRGNFANYELVSKFYPEPKMICFVRNMPDIFASMEKLFRNNQHKANIIINDATMQGISTPRRVQIWHNTFEKMMRGFYRNIEEGNDKKILFIKYESFCLQPHQEMMRFYNYLNLPAVELNTKNIEQIIKEDEGVYEENYSGLLKIRPVLEMKQPDAREVLGGDIYEWLMEAYEYYNSYFGYQ